jgi:hypothetical protein
MGFSAPEAPMRVYFSPSPEPERAILQTLQSAQKFVHAALYQLTDPEIADVLIEIAKRGIELKFSLTTSRARAARAVFCSARASTSNSTLIQGSCTISSPSLTARE